MPAGMGVSAMVELRIVVRSVVGTEGNKRRTSSQTPFKYGIDSRTSCVMGLLELGIVAWISVRSLA